MLTDGITTKSDILKWPSKSLVISLWMTGHSACVVFTIFFLLDPILLWVQVYVILAYSMPTDDITAKIWYSEIHLHCG
jgi:hypothetical protein